MLDFKRFIFFLCVNLLFDMLQGDGILGEPRHMVQILLGQLSLRMLFLVLSNERVAALGPARLHMLFLNFLGGFSLDLGCNHISEGFSNKGYEPSSRFGVLMADFC